jgi:copper chaperone
MNLNLTASLPLAQPPTSACGCCPPRTTVTTNSITQDRKKDMSNIAIATAFAVTGMTCGHCVAAVTEELSALPGVTEVSVDLVAGGTSTVTLTSDTPIDLDQVAAALDEAGVYRLATD